MRLERIWLYVVPSLGLAGVAVALGIFFFSGVAVGPSHRAGPDTLLLLCDESLRYPMEAPDIEHESGIIGRFQRRAGLRVKVEYGRLDLLSDPLERGGKGDLLITADAGYIVKAGEAGLIHHTRTVAQMAPVILVGRGNPHGVRSVHDLAGAGLRLAAAGERAGPLRSATEDVLSAHGLSLQKPGDVTLTYDCVFETARAVYTGRADAAVVWRHVGRLYHLNTEIIEVPSERSLKFDVQAAVLTAAENTAGASLFAEFLTGPAAREVFQMYGLTPAGEGR